MVDVPTAVSAPVETLSLIDDRHAISSMTGTDLIVDLDPPMPSGQVIRAATKIAEALIAKQGGPRSFDDLLPAELGHESSARELRAPVGFFEGEPVEVVIGDASPHALIGGPSGSGKTNFLYALLGSLAARYTPDELALYLLDFKEGVSFAGLAPGRKDASWLPHARLVGVNVNTDREFGLALLRFLADELRRRSAAAKEHEVTNLADLREADPGGHWPRIVAVIDEFQYLFAGRDQVTATATQLLEDIARRGRSQGIHLVLASQDVAGIEAFWGKPAVFEQCTLRIAMPKARRVLAETNNAAVSAPEVARGDQPRLRRRARQPAGAHAGREQQERVRPAAAPAVGGVRGAGSRGRACSTARIRRSWNSSRRTSTSSRTRSRGRCWASRSTSPRRRAAWTCRGRRAATSRCSGRATAEALSIMDSSARSLSRQYERRRGRVPAELPDRGVRPGRAGADRAPARGRPRGDPGRRPDRRARVDDGLDVGRREDPAAVRRRRGPAGVGGEGRGAAEERPRPPARGAETGAGTRHPHDRLVAQHRPAEGHAGVRRHRRHRHVGGARRPGQRAVAVRGRPGGALVPAPGPRVVLRPHDPRRTRSDHPVPAPGEPP